MVIEIRIHGRGGQGAQVASTMLAHAFHKGGRFVQAFAAYGGERRGAPVTAFVRVNDRPIRVRCEIRSPNYVLVFDPTLMTEVLTDIRPGATLVVNSATTVPNVPPGVTVTLLDATSIARRHGLAPVVNSAMVGAFAGATSLISLEDVTWAISETTPSRLEANEAACTEAYWSLHPIEQASGGRR